MHVSEGFKALIALVEIALSTMIYNVVFIPSESINSSFAFNEFISITDKAVGVAFFIFSKCFQDSLS